jgi:uncharacterized membrane protein (GlpM family)
VISERTVTVLLSVLIVILVAVVQERSRHLAAIIATMPLTAPLAMWIVFSSSRGDHRQTADFVGPWSSALSLACCSYWRAGSASGKGGGS